MKRFFIAVSIFWGVLLCSVYGTPIIGSYHKTGTALFYSIFTGYQELDTNFQFIFNHHFNRISDDVIANNKCVVIIRHPYEVIMSGMRYHQITPEEWVHIPIKKLNNKTYQEYIKSLYSDDEKISFEMNNCAYETINDMYNDIKNRNFNKNVLFVKIEDLYCVKNIPQICEKIKNHLGNIELEKLIEVFYRCLSTSYHRTHPINEYTFNKGFKDIHYQEIEKLFPNDLLETLDYCIH